MSNKLYICDICLKNDFNFLLKEINKLDYKFEIIIGCHNTCGISRLKKTVIYNNKLIVKDNISELIEELKKQI